MLYCNYRVDMLERYDERRAAYERWRTEVYEQDLARLAAQAPGAPGRPAASGRRPVSLVDQETLRFARCLTERADRLALTEPYLDQDPARARLLAAEMAEACLEEVTR